MGSNRDAGVALSVFGTGSMLSAAVVLISSSREQLRGALAQGTFPAIALLGLAIWAWT
jgi:putative membrane protein